MKFTVFGATGPSGLQLVEESLEKGHEVTAVVRNPDKLQIKHDNLRVEKVDISKEDDLVPHIKGRDAVMSCLGAQVGIFTPCSLYTDSIKTITGAMRKGGVTRFVGITSWGTKYDPGLPWAVRWILRHVFLRNILKNMGEMEDYLTEHCQDIDFTAVRPPELTDEKSSDDAGLPWGWKYLLRPVFLKNYLNDQAVMEDFLTDSCPDLDFTVVRPPALTMAKASGKEVMAVEGQYVPGASKTLSRRDLADFMLKCVVNGEWKKKHVSVGIK